LAVGDSFVWGYGVELDEIFTEVLEDLDKKLDIINAGQIGHTPQQYTRIIKRFLKNDVPFNGVLYNFYSGNDISREYTFREWSRNIKRFPDLASFSYQKTSFVAKNAVEYEIEMKKNENEIKVHQGMKKTFIEIYLEDWFVTFRIVRRIYWMLTGKWNLRDGLNPYQSLSLSDSHKETIKDRYYNFSQNPKAKSANGQLLTFHTYHINEVACETISESRKHSKSQQALNYPLAIESITEAKKLCDALNREFYFVYIPSKAEIYADTLCAHLDEQQKSIVKHKLQRLRNKMTRMCTVLGITMIDLTDACIAEQKKGMAIYNSEDPHFTVQGHKLWAGVIHNYIMNNHSTKVRL